MLSTDFNGIISSDFNPLVFLFDNSFAMMGLKVWHISIGQRNDEENRKK
jgi:hypothetical protein